MWPSVEQRKMCDCVCWIRPALDMQTLQGEKDYCACYIESGYSLTVICFMLFRRKIFNVILLSKCKLWWCVGRNNRLMLDSWVLNLALTLGTQSQETMCPFQAKVPSSVKRSYMLVLFCFFLNKWGTIFTNTQNSARYIKCLMCLTYIGFFFPSSSNCFFTYKIWTYSVSYSNYKIPLVFWNNFQSRKKRGHLLLSEMVTSLGFFRNCSFFFLSWGNVSIL